MAFGKKTNNNDIVDLTPEQLRSICEALPEYQNRATETAKFQDLTQQLATVEAELAANSDNDQRQVNIDDAAREVLNGKQIADVMKRHTATIDVPALTRRRDILKSAMESQKAILNTAEVRFIEAAREAVVPGYRHVVKRFLEVMATAAGIEELVRQLNEAFDGVTQRTLAAHYTYHLPGGIINIFGRPEYDGQPSQLKRLADGLTENQLMSKSETETIIKAHRLTNV